MIRPVFVYSHSACHASVCAPADMPLKEVIEHTEKACPSGTDEGWTLSPAETFSDGTENGRELACSRGHTRHWLLCS